MATFEEYLRAQILERYELAYDFIYNKKNKKPFAHQISKCIKKNNNSKSPKLYYALNTDLWNLIELVKIKKMFNNEQCEKLGEIRKLRNIIMHHNVLVLGDARNYSDMIYNRNIISNQLKLLAEFLPEEYAENFLNEIRKIRCDFEDYKVII